MALTTNFKLMFWLLIARLLPHFILTLQYGVQEDSVWDKRLIFASYPQVSLELERSHSLVHSS